MVKPTRSLTIGSVETTFVDTTPIDTTPIVDVPAETLPPPTDRAPMERPSTTPKVFIPTHSDVEGLVLKDNMDLDMVTAELTRATKAKWPGEGKLSSARNKVVLLYLLGTSKPINIGQVIYDSIVQLNFTKEEPLKKLLFLCLITECLESCRIKIHAVDIVVNEIGEKAISKKLDVDTKERAKTKARKPLSQAKETNEQNF
ncbi:hypothetical protein M9H77_03678 [Catharanthus roseus]|uniref:Uncharacterized protein n=1 Tax=Catharanthus roseus TaxID=4058 RepID=A0ACC0CC33_CATRO|nr:hypothetical protein M9H77_03678 [Catharanthus roseus]